MAVGSAALLIAAELTTLFTVHVAGRAVAVRTVAGGAHHDYALVPIGVLAAWVGAGAWRGGSRRTAALAGALLGLSALLIMLTADLPDAHSAGLSGSAVLGYRQASSTPGVGLYLETLGAVGLLLASGLKLFGLASGGPSPPHNPGPDADSAAQHSVAEGIRS